MKRMNKKIVIPLITSAVIGVAGCSTTQQRPQTEMNAELEEMKKQNAESSTTRRAGSMMKAPRGGYCQRPANLICSWRFSSRS